MSDSKRLERIEEKIDKISEHLGSIDVTLAEQHVTLLEHQRRSRANEKAVEMLSSEFKPVVVHVNTVKAVSKILAAVLSCGAIVKLALVMFGK